MVWVSILVYIMQYALSRKLVVHYFCNLALRKLNISSWCIRQLLCVVNTVIIWSRTVKIHLVLCVDVGWVLQELQHHRQGGDTGGQVQCCVSIDVHQVGVSLMFQEQRDGAVLFTLNRLPDVHNHKDIPVSMYLHVYDFTRTNWMYLH